MGFKDRQFYLLNSILIEDCKDLVDIGLTDEGFDDSKLLICDDLLVDGFPYFFLLLVAFLVKVYAFEVELD